MKEERCMNSKLNIVAAILRWRSRSLLATHAELLNPIWWVLDVKWNWSGRDCKENEDSQLVTILTLICRLKMRFWPLFILLYTYFLKFHITLRFVRSVLIPNRYGYVDWSALFTIDEFAFLAVDERLKKMVSRWLNTIYVISTILVVDYGSYLQYSLDSGPF